jgi:transposase
MASPADLPNLSAEAPDVDELRAWMKRMIAALRFAELVAVIVTFLVRIRKLNTDLARQVAQLKRRRPASETLARLERQLVLAFPGVVVVPARPKSKERRARGKSPGRRGLPAHLPRVDDLNPVPPELRTCPVCGSEMTTVGHTECETLDLIPAQLFVRRRIDETVACPHDDTIVSAPVPPELVPRGKLARGLIVEALLDKYVEHQPIERQCRRWERAGVPIASQTLGRSVAVAIDVLGPLAAIIADRTRASALLGTDASGLRVLDRDHPNGVRSGTVWCWVGGKYVTFVFAASGDAMSFKRFLGGDLARTIQCDGTSVTNCIEKAGGKRPGCWSHGRRGFVEAARGGDLDALEAIRIIRKLFAIERLSAIKSDTPDERRARRLEHSAAVLEELAAWVADKRATTPPKTPLGKALGYLHRQWKRLTLFLDDGRIELTNNRVERELRSLVLGRKNWLFVDGDLNGERTASILTILATAIAHRINPRAYLHLVTQLIVDKWPRARYAELLPAALATRHPELRLPSPPRPALPRPP